MELESYKYFSSDIAYGPLREKTSLPGFPPGHIFVLTQPAQIKRLARFVKFLM